MLDIKVMLPVFSSVFMAELGDKTQLATLSFVAGGAGRLEIFLASSLALVLSTLIAVMAGGLIGKVVPPSLLKVLSGLVFLVMGGIFVFQGVKGLRV